MGCSKKHVAAFYQSGGRGAIPAGLFPVKMVAFIPFRITLTMVSHSYRAYQTAICQVLGGLFVFLLGLYVVRASSQSGSSRMLVSIAMLVGALTLVIALDKRYWLLCPVLYYFNIKIPGLPFSGMELGMISLVSVHFVRVAFRRDVAIPLNRGIFSAIPLVSWIAMVYLLNPAGLHMTGANVMGGRFYFDIALGFFAFLTLASIRIDEKDAKILFYTLVFESVFIAFRNLVRGHRFVVASGIEEEMSRYYLISFVELYYLLLSRWALFDIFKVPFRIVLMVLTALFAVVSGKRQVFGSLALLPVLRVFLKRRDALLTGLVVFFAAVAVSFVVAGDGHFYHIPESATRSLAVVFPKYRKYADNSGASDLFRREIRRYSYQIIREKPWLGRKGLAMDAEETAWRYFGRAGGSLYEGHSVSGNWHNLYLAYACDFGVPCLLLAVWFLFSSLSRSVRACRENVSGTFLPACCLYCSFHLFDIAIFGWVSGHSSMSTVSIFFYFGLLLALCNGYGHFSLERHPHSVLGRFDNRRLPRETTIAGFGGEIGEQEHASSRRLDTSTRRT